MQCKINISNLIKDDEIKYLRVYYYIFPNKIKISFYSKNTICRYMPWQNYVPFEQYNNL